MKGVTFYLLMIMNGKLSLCMDGFEWSSGFGLLEGLSE